MSKVFKSLKSGGLKSILGLAAPLVLGPAGLGLTGGTLMGASALTGAGLGALGGGGLKGALLGGAGGALSGGLGSNLVGRLAPGISDVAKSSLSGMLSGAVTGAGGGLKNALMGGAMGGLGGYVTGGGSIPGLGKMGTDTINWNDGTSSTIGGTGILGKLQGNMSNASAWSKAAPVVSGGLDMYAQDKAASELEEQQRRALGYITPIMNETFDPGDLSQTPGYQFQLDQGQKALDRVSASRGSYFSGQSMKDAMDYSQGLADQTFNDAYQRWLSDRNQRLSAAGAAAGITQGIGSTRANSTLNKSQSLAQSLSALMGQLGGGTTAYNPKTGTYYDPRSAQTSNWEELLRKLSVKS